MLSGLQGLQQQNEKRYTKRNLVMDVTLSRQENLLIGQNIF